MTIDTASSVTIPTALAELSEADCPDSRRAPGIWPRIITVAITVSPSRTATLPAAPLLVLISTPLDGPRGPARGRPPSPSWHARPYGGDVIDSDRTGADACPGALRPHHAADGPLARVRIPGGMLTADQLDRLALAAAEFGDGSLQLTSRGNLQLRGLSDTAAVGAAIAEAGLLPSATHERVRNILASPLTGRVGGRADLRALVAELDEAIRCRPELAGLPGKFWFALDDGTGDVAGFPADVGVQLVAEGAAVLLAGRDTGCRLAADEAVAALVSIACRFLASGEKAWRIAELDDPRMLLDGFPVGPTVLPAASATRPPVGWIVQDDGRVALGAAVPLGVLSARQAQFVAAIGAPVVITPWRSLLVFDLTEEVADTALRVLAPLGLVFDDNSRWLEVSSCVGSPGCRRSRADVRAEAARETGRPAGGGPVHFAGCERACGRPPGARVMIAADGGYLPVVG